jgi:restriction endonuclease S subunit
MNMMVKPEKGTVTIFDVATVTKGSQLSKTDIIPGPYPVMNGRTEPVGFHLEANRDGGAIAMTEGGECGRVTLMSEPYWSGGHSYDIRPQEGIDLEYLYYALLHHERDFAAASKGVAIKNLSLGSLKGVRFHIHGGNEQRFIASTLSTVDAKLTALREKADGLRQFKTGLMQRLFSQELQFTREDGSEYPDWHEKRLGEILSYEQPTQYLVASTGYSDFYKIPVLTAGKTFILGYTNETHGIFDNLPTIIFDDFTTSFKFVDFPFKAKSSAMKMLSIIGKEDDIRFFYAAMLQINFKAGDHKRYWISEYQNHLVPYPHPEEQRKIADFLSALDAKIDAVTDQITHMETFKKGLLQKMFA